MRREVVGANWFTRPALEVVPVRVAILPRDRAAGGPVTRNVLLKSDGRAFNVLSVRAPHPSLVVRHEAVAAGVMIRVACDPKALGEFASGEIVIETDVPQCRALTVEVVVARD
jgi:hypothetical protein